MVGQKTHQQQMRIIEKREDTSNAGDDFNADLELKKSPEERKREAESARLHSKPEIQSEDRTMLRGVNQRSGQNKKHNSK
jgi:hypothetical protein